MTQQPLRILYGTFVNVNVACASNEMLLFFPMLSSIMGTTDDDVDKLTTAVNGKNSVRHISQRISIPVGVIIQLKALCFELYDRNKCDDLPDTAIIAAIYTAHLIVMMSTRNQDASNTEMIKNSVNKNSLGTSNSEVVFPTKVL